MYGPTRPSRRAISRSMSAGLRRALGDGRPGRRYVVNIPGRGYSFVGTILAPGARDTAPIAAAEAAPPSSEDAAEDLRPVGDGREPDRAGDAPSLRHAGRAGRHRQDHRRRGGGRQARRSAQGRRPFRRPQPHRGPGAGAERARLGSRLPVRSDQSGQNIVSFLKDKQALVILDNCEHVIEAAAVLPRPCCAAPGER